MSYDKNIRICQHRESDVHQGKEPHGRHILRLTNPDVNRKRIHQLFCYMFFRVLFLRTKITKCSCEQVDMTFVKAA